MYYVELLRASRALRVVVILLGLIVVADLIFRLTLSNALSPETLIAQMRNSPTARVTETTLTDGGTRIVIDDPRKKLHAVIVRHGNAYSFKETEPTAVVSVNPRTKRSEQRVEVQTHEFELGPRYELGALFAMTMPVGLIVVTLLAGPLAKENDGHLELAWTKPAARERYALAAVAIDLVTIVVSQLATAIVVVLATAMWGLPALSADPDAAASAGLALVAPLAMYACLTAASASLKRGPGLAIGIGWVVAFIVPAVANVTADMHVLFWGAVYRLSSALSYADPLTYIVFLNAHTVAPAVATTLGALVVSAILAVVYSAVAILQWRRVEA